MSDVKHIDIKEFREQGYLQEVNRQFFHPMGLALAISIDDDGSETLGGIWDYRTDPEGIQFDLKSSNFDRISTFAARKTNVDAQREKIATKRQERLGFDIEPIPEVTNA